MEDTKEQKQENTEEAVASATNAESSQAAGQLYTTIAICGCGHDGRLGVGNDAPSCLKEIALLDAFLPSSVSTEMPPSCVVPGDIIEVACGAYHTLVLTTSGLYGWGAHDKGQLGLGQPSQATAASPLPVFMEHTTDTVKDMVCPSYARPTCIPFFDLVEKENPSSRSAVSKLSEKETKTKACAAADVGDGGGGAAAVIVSIHCGAEHSMVRTTDALYVTGRNDGGQLGLGHTTNVYTWTRLGRFAGPHQRAPLDISLPAFVRSDHVRTRVMQGRLTHISCGTKHTLLAVADALVLEFPKIASSATAPRLRFYPGLVLACGEGDFGELGYDPIAWVFPAHERPPPQARVPKSTTLYAFPWQAARAAAKRRLPYSNPFFHPVDVAELMHSARQLPAEDARAVHAALVDAEEAGEGECRLSHSTWWESKGSQACSAATAVSSDAATTADAAQWDVATLQAMHLHSAVSLRARAESPACASRVLHWGCYYCGEVEDAAASIPRLLLNDDDEAKPNACGVRWGIHAGEEILFRYALPPDSTGVCVEAPRIQVIGTRNLGRGDDDDEARTWVDIATKSPNTIDSTAAEKPRFVSAVCGRTHFLATLRTRHSNDEACVVVVGFGDNLHGQLGHPFARGGTVLEALGDDAVLTPQSVLQVGDTLRAASAVTESVRAASAAHLHVGHPVKAGSKVSTSRKWVVEKIRAAGAGARHSVFVVDVRVSEEGES